MKKNHFYFIIIYLILFVTLICQMYHGYDPNIVSISNENAITKAMIDLAIDGDVAYSSLNAKDIAKAAIKVLRSMLSTKSVQEGGFQITLQVEKRILDLQEEYDLVPVIETPVTYIPKVRARFLW